MADRGRSDLWISRSHLGAVGVGALAIGISGLALGVVIGRASATRAAPVEVFEWGEAPDDSLLTLLARVEASADPSSGVERLTFPGALSGEDDEIVPPQAAPVVGGPTEVSAPAQAEIPGG